MKTIHKYVLDVVDELDIATPEAFKVIHVGEQNGRLCLWAEVDTSTRTVSRTFCVVGTGNGNPRDHLPPCCHVGSAVCPPFVWHVYQKQD